MEWYEKLQLALGLCNYRVVYNDKERSRPMPKRVAKAYCKLFGGKTIVKTLDPIVDIAFE